MTRKRRYCWFDELPLQSAALQHGKEAYGARFIKPGFSWSEQLDLAWALGFPHMAFVCDGHPDDDDPVEVMQQHYHVGPVFPRRIAVCWLREETDFLREGGPPWTERVDEPFTEDEAKSLVHALDRRELVMLEALTGPDFMISAILEQIAKYVEARDVEAVAGTLAPLIMHLPLYALRLPEKARNEVMARLQELSEIELPRTINRGYVVESFDYALDRGKDDKWDRQALLHGHSPEKLLAQARKANLGPGGLIDARDAFVAGDEIIEILRGRIKSADTERKEDIVDQYGWVKSEQTVLLFMDMFSGRATKESLKTWFKLRAEYARPILEDTEKAGGAPAKRAKSVLKYLDKVAG